MPQSGDPVGPTALEPTALELAAGNMFGVMPCAAGGGEPSRSAVEPLTALKQAVLPSLKRPPCVVTFSGGRDSSILLAVATRVARDQGLELPLPLTLRFVGAANTEESSWQELVVNHLRLGDWQRLDLTHDECDWIGPLAAPALRRHGSLARANAFVIGRMAAIAEGGSLLTGAGGDELFGEWHYRPLADVLARRVRPRPYDALRLGYAALPRAVRVLRERRRPRAPQRWLRPAAARSVAALAARQAADEPVWWRDRTRWRTRLRSMARNQLTLETLANDANVVASSPLTSPGFVDAVAADGGRLGYGDRTTAMLTLFKDLLPAEILRRETKAAFDEVGWRRHSRRFAEQWDGSGVDPEIVDADALRREWLSPNPDGRSSSLLQLVWLQSQTDSRPAGGVRG